MWDLYRRLRRRKIVQWTLAYVAAAALVIGLLADVSSGFPWGVRILRVTVAVAAVGVVITLVVGWYHGEWGRQRVTRTELFLLGGLGLAAGGAGWIAATTTDLAGPTAEELPEIVASSPEDGVRVAVLPCEAMPLDSTTEYLALGLADQVIAQLSRLGRVRPMALSSIQSYAYGDRDIREIATDLKVAAVLDCTLRSDGERVRTTAHLFDAQGGETLWSEPYTREIGDILGLEAEIALRIAEAVTDGLTSTERDRIDRPPPTLVEDAWLDYLRGQQVGGATEERIQAAIGYYERAIERDPEFALAHAGLGRAFTELGLLGLRPPRESRDTARAAARRALRLDDELGEAHAVLGGLLHKFDWDWEEADAAFRRAVWLSPSSYMVHDSYGHFLILMGRSEEGIAEYREALALDPMNPMAHALLAWAFLHSDRAEEAVEQGLETLERFPEFQISRLPLAWSLAELGRYEKAVAEVERVAPFLRDDPQLRATNAALYAAAGRGEEARQILGSLQELAERRYVDPINFAYIYSALGDTLVALDYLEEAYRLGSPIMPFIKTEEFGFILNTIRPHPRFQELMQKMRFPE